MSPKIIIGYIVGIIVLMGIIIYAGSRGTTTTAGANDPDRPIALVKDTNFDFGKMTNSEIRNKVFEVTNIGKNDLELTNVSTSCDCTYVYVTTNGQKSPKFTMHGSNAWKGIVKTGETAQIEVIYEPAIMPVQGKVERVVSVVTNDPNNPELKFTVRAEVSN